MKILLIGDIVGNVGVKKVKQELNKLKEKENIDFIIANGENSAEGMGITTKIYNELINCGVDAITMGNHTWGKREIFSIIDNKNLIRPANYPKDVPGNGYGVFNCKNKKIAVISLLGRVSMGVLPENPFIIGKEIVENLKNKADYIFIDFHAEASAEKIALGYYLDGKATCVFGTHTHVQTADETILEKGTAYITDIGMTGPAKSVIGMDIEASIKRFVTTLPERYKVSQCNETSLCGCIVEIDENVNKVVNIKRIKV